MKERACEEERKRVKARGIASEEERVKGRWRVNGRVRE